LKHICFGFETTLFQSSVEAGFISVFPFTFA